ncbi:hypothetical protein GCM10010193_68130 [Kitasatospora atroaurantiaca]
MNVRVAGGLRASLKSRRVHRGRAARTQRGIIRTFRYGRGRVGVPGGRHTGISPQ